MEQYIIIDNIPSATVVLVTYLIMGFLVSIWFVECSKFYIDLKKEHAEKPTFDFVFVTGVTVFYCIYFTFWIIKTVLVALYNFGKQLYIDWIKSN